MPKTNLSMAVLLAGLATGACSSASSHAAARTTPEPAPGAADRVRADSLRRPYTEADIEFMSGMIYHHNQAIRMAGWAPSHEASPAVQRLAARIVNAQQDEIATMAQWLRDRGQPVPDPASGHSMHMMPGMLTEAQMQQLDEARGQSFDNLFLAFMIQHHRGAVSMVRDLFATPGAARDELVFKFANDVNVDQSTEIARMERMLAALPSGSSTP
jgi:uncharacterized protein (DUF305 family)